MKTSIKHKQIYTTNYLPKPINHLMRLFSNIASGCVDIIDFITTEKVTLIYSSLKHIGILTYYPVIINRHLVLLFYFTI
jgi:hypothetical protein